jgi:hypothetical protein
MAEIEELLDVNPVPFYCFCLRGRIRSCQKCAEISYFDFDLKTNIMIFMN